MSGHSRWAKLKHSKGATDAKKAAMFMKFTRIITVAAKEGGASTETNFKLRTAVDQATSIGMPKDNIERAIKRGAGGEGEKEKLENAIYEILGPGNVAIIVEALTDNRNRTAGNLRRILNKHGGSLSGQNALLWMFEHKGVAHILNAEKISDMEGLELELIDAGAEDFKERMIDDSNKELLIYMKPENMQKVKGALEAKKIIVDSLVLEWVAKNPAQISPEAQKQLDKIFDEMDEDPDITNYYDNLGD